MFLNRTLKLTGAIGLLGPMNFAAVKAQEAIYAQPVVGVAKKVNSAEQTDKVSITPSVSIEWDSNVLRRNPDFLDTRPDNVRTSPAVNFTIGRIFGRTRISASGSVGYDFNTRFKYLDQERINANAAITMPIGSRCPVQFDGSYRRSQYDLSNTDRLVSSLQSISELSVGLTCQRRFLSPNIGAAFRKSTNSADPQANSDYVEAHAGVQLSLPSVGTVVFGAQIARISRPEAKAAIGVEDNTDIRRYFIGITRTAASRVEVNGKIGYVQAEPTRPDVSSSSSFYVDGEIIYDTAANLKISLNGLQDVQQSFGVAASYVHRREAGAFVSYTGLYKTSIRIGYARQWRRFEIRAIGNNPILTRDRIETISVSGVREVARRITIGLTGGARFRNANDLFYEFDGQSVSLNIGAKF